MTTETKSQTIDPQALFTKPGCGSDICCGDTAERVILLAIEVDGAAYLSDRMVLIAVSALEGAGDNVQPTPIGIAGITATDTAQILAYPAGSDPSSRTFLNRYLDALEPAGFRVRPTTHDKIHAILDSAGSRVGCIIPSMDHSLRYDGVRPTRTAK